MRTQVRGLPYGAASDAWAVGCILFNLIALERPFYSTSVLAMARQIVAVEFTQEAKRALDVCAHPPDVKALVSSAGLLNPDPEKRTTLRHVLDIYPLEEDG